ncbi:YybH family protein [Priestia megaterium]|uniref:YybH family protein n=1 Tax=Priestia megaterium TaxID=1404 RepID=UPI002040D825|nr:nuclear transport factor 2 family protein [Priestia megaterium]MCM3186849.1 nuclear transport factor 2 family protein [Priestia megaterium]
MNQEIKELINKYLKSINEAEDISIAEEIWLNSPEASFIHPRGHENGWEEVKEGFYFGTMRDLLSKRHLELVGDISIQNFGDTAVLEFYWDFNAVFRKDGDALNTKGRETQVLYKTKEHGWKIVHVHYSNMPVTGEKSGF